LDNKAPDAFRTISEVADELDLPQHVLRFWESRFREIKPMKRGGGRRYYRPDDVELLRGIRHLLYGEGYTIRGVQRILREQGIKFVQAVWLEGAAQPPHGASDEEEFVDDAIETGAEPQEEPAEAGGLRRRFASLIGRDLSDRHDDTEMRREPPLKSAPEPRIEPNDRIVQTAAPEPSFAAPPQMLPLDSAPVSAPATPPAATGGLARDDVRKLHAALHELAECRKLIEAAMLPPV
jgi:DNA-binding transcriptional MerR regulator